MKSVVFLSHLQACFVPKISLHKNDLMTVRKVKWKEGRKEGRKDLPQYLAV
jgi:hypothetical protein